MRRVLALLATTSLLIAGGCGGKSYEHRLDKTLEQMSEPPNWVTFAGNGEPTMHPRFSVVVQRVVEVRDRIAPGVKVVVMSNGLSAGRPAVRESLNRVDERLMKLDPGPVHLVNGVAYDRSRLVEDLRGLVDVTVQALVVEGPGYSGASEQAVEEWLAALARLQPKAVQVYSIARPPADARVKPVARGWRRSQHARVGSLPVRWRSSSGASCRGPSCSSAQPSAASPPSAWRASSWRPSERPASWPPSA